MDSMTHKNYPSTDSILVARQLKIISQVDAFTISATRKIQYVFKKLFLLKSFVKDIFGVYLNKIHHIVFSLNSSVKVWVNTNCMRCLATKEVKIPLIFKYTWIVLRWKQTRAFKIRNLICLRVCLCMQYC